MVIILQNVILYACDILLFFSGLVAMAWGVGCAWQEENAAHDTHDMHDFDAEALRCGVVKDDMDCLLFYLNQHD